MYDWFHLFLSFFVFDSFVHRSLRSPLILFYFDLVFLRSRLSRCLISLFFFCDRSLGFSLTCYYFSFYLLFFRRADAPPSSALMISLSPLTLSSAIHSRHHLLSPSTIISDIRSLSFFHVALQSEPDSVSTFLSQPFLSRSHLLSDTYVFSVYLSNFIRCSPVPVTLPDAVLSTVLPQGAPPDSSYWNNGKWNKS